MWSDRISRWQKKGTSTTIEGPETRSVYRVARFEYLMQGNLPIGDRFVYCVHPVMGDLFKMASPADRKAKYRLPDEQDGSWLEEVVGIKL